MPDWFGSANVFFPYSLSCLETRFSQIRKYFVPKLWKSTSYLNAKNEGCRCICPSLHKYICYADLKCVTDRYIWLNSRMELRNQIFQICSPSPQMRQVWTLIKRPIWQTCTFDKGFFSTQSLPSIFAFSFVIYFSSVAAGCYPLTFMVSNEPVSNIFPIVQLS